MIGIDLFAGCGGMSLGAAQAGIDVVAAIEIDKATAGTYRRNHPTTDVIIADIRAVNAIETQRRGEEVVLFGGSPCQGFSVSNQRTRGANNPLNHLCMQFVRFANVVCPDWIVFENVAGILQSHKGRYVLELEAAFKALGYEITHGVVCAADVGVPQVRKRFFLIASRNTTPPDVYVEPMSKTVTVDEAINDLPHLAGGARQDAMPYRSAKASDYAMRLRGGMVTCSGHLVSRNNTTVTQRYRHIRQGRNWQDVPPHLMANYANRLRCHTGIYRRLRGDECSVVIGNFRKNMLIHPHEDRGLSIREAARLQSFPDSYEFSGPIGSQQQQVGNAVPPLLAKSIFQQLSKPRCMRTVASTPDPTPIADVA